MDETLSISIIGMRKKIVGIKDFIVCLFLRIQGPKIELASITHLHAPKQSSCISASIPASIFPRTNQQIKTENRAFLAAIVGTSLTWDIVGIGANKYSLQNAGLEIRPKVWRERRKSPPHSKFPTY
jgi:hypothetical protein